MGYVPPPKKASRSSAQAHSSYNQPAGYHYKGVVEQLPRLTAADSRQNKQDLHATSTELLHPSRRTVGHTDAPGSFMAKTLLIADDNDVFRHALCEALKRESDFEVCGEARDGRDAIDKAQQLHPDLIILDLAMPVMNGLDASRAIKKLMPSVPIILFTLNVYPFLEVEAQSAGIAAVVSKSAGMSGLMPSARSLLYCNAAGSTAA